MFWSVDVSVCWYSGLLMFWYVDVLVCRRFSFGLSTFRDVGVPVCRRFRLSTFRFVDVLTSYLQKGPLWHTKSCLWIWSSFCRRHIRMDFFNDIFHNLALLEFYFLNIIYILLYIDFILSIFFQHSKILTRASHHWCLASNIVLVHDWFRDSTSRRQGGVYAFILIYDYMLDFIYIWRINVAHSYHNYQLSTDLNALI